MTRKCAGHVFVYFPNSDTISGLDFCQLDKKLGFEDNPPEIGNLGKVDYGSEGMFQAIVVEVFAGKQGKTKAEELWEDHEFRLRLTGTGRQFATSNSIPIVPKEFSAILDATGITNTTTFSSDEEITALREECGALRTDVSKLFAELGSTKRRLEESEKQYQALKKKCTVIEAASGNNVLDADAMDKVTERVSKCEDRLSAVEDLNRNIGGYSTVSSQKPVGMTDEQKQNYYFEKYDPTKLESWRAAIQLMLIDEYTEDELTTSCPTVKGAKNSSEKRPGLDPIRLQMIYEVVKKLCAKRTHLTPKAWGVPSWPEINRKLGQVLQKQREDKAKADKAAADKARADKARADKEREEDQRKSASVASVSSQ